jgi:hypothetical protein
MENAWNEYLKLERDVEQLKQTHMMVVRLSHSQTAASQ